MTKWHDHRDREWNDVSQLVIAFTGRREKLAVRARRQGCQNTRNHHHLRHHPAPARPVDLVISFIYVFECIIFRFADVWVCSLNSILLLFLWVMIVSTCPTHVNGIHLWFIIYVYMQL